MKVKLTIAFKSGSKLKMIKNIGEPPKGTDKDTHYLLESHSLAENMSSNGLNIFIPPTQIEKVLIQPKGSRKNGQVVPSSSDRGQNL